MIQSIPFIKYLTGFLAGVFACLTVLALLPEPQITAAVITFIFGAIFMVITYALVVIERKVMAAKDIAVGLVSEQANQVVTKAVSHIKPGVTVE